MEFNERYRHHTIRLNCSRRHRKCPGSTELKIKINNRKEGIITGISGGATFATAMIVAERANPGATILCMLPDTGERYLSSPLFANIEEDMDEAENTISLSTPNYHMP